jgi:hypothetical protein
MLNGSLNTVGLPDVLRLIASSGKAGLLRIDDASPSGRIFLVDGRIAFATTRNEDDPIDDLLHMEYRADYVGSADDRRIVDLNDLLENNPEAFNRFLEQMVVEVLSRLLRVDEGQFRFDVDIRTRREIPHSFDVEEMIQQAAVRAEAWRRILEVVPSASEPFRMAPRLDDPEEIVLGSRDWALLAATGSSSTINDIAQKLKIFEFAAAKKVAELAQRGLVDFIQTEVSETSMAAAELLSEVLETGAIDSVIPDEVTPEPEFPVEAASEEITFEDLPQPEPVPEDAETAAGAAPTWLPVESDTEDDPVPLLEELHRLHEAEAMEEQDANAATDNSTEDPADAHADEKASEVPLPEEEELDVDDPDGGDLATRWKNLRKAKRGVHAANE